MTFRGWFHLLFFSTLVTCDGKVHEGKADGLEAGKDAALPDSASAELNFDIKLQVATSSQLSLASEGQEWTKAIVMIPMVFVVVLDVNCQE